MEKPIATIPAGAIKILLINQDGKMIEKFITADDEGVDETQ